MGDIAELQKRLGSLIEGDLAYEAEQLLPQLGGHAVPVLQQFLRHQDPLVRATVLELAGQVGDPQACRLVLGALSDSDPEVVGAATFQVRCCRQKQVLPDLVAALEKQDDSSIQSVLVTQIGEVGTPEQVPLLREKRGRTQDESLQHQIDLALVKLGEDPERSSLIERLKSLDRSVRFQALQDTLVVQDPGLARYFGSALMDYADVIQLTIPEESVVPVYARICDAAVTVMAGLGYEFTFAADDMWVRTEKELDEARSIVEKLNRPEQ